MQVAYIYTRTLVFQRRLNAQEVSFFAALTFSQRSQTDQKKDAPSRPPVLSNEISTSSQQKPHIGMTRLIKGKCASLG